VHMLAFCQVTVGRLNEYDNDDNGIRWKKSLQCMTILISEICKTDVFLCRLVFTVQIAHHTHLAFCVFQLGILLPVYCGIPVALALCHACVLIERFIHTGVTTALESTIAVW